ncbi:HPr family phosphocarrier protein [Virgibacillus litoralis]|uniref:Phosphocarrier protein n=1 Tax=Virgibacillus litoralis TaxID=578221 RepID=A0ABS4HFU9_9BACI|nr:HPr family phosphocarrier protein [Virgibacillus litoralis]MBP1949776.1 phosphocarrier protein [Virgibacillus litoralis]
MNEITQEVVVNITEEETIIELSQLTQKYHSEIYLKKIVGGSVLEISLKSFLGLITLQLQNGDHLTVRVIGEDSKEAIDEVVRFLS